MIPFSLQALASISPILILSFSLVLIMLLIAFVRSHCATALLSATALIIALAVVVNALHSSPIDVTILLNVNAMVQHYWALILFSALVCLGMSYAYIEPATSFREEWYLLLLLSTVGALVLAASNHFAALFIGLELVSVPLYGLAAFALKHKLSLEAGLKYLILSAVGSAFLLFGIALIYADTGNLTYHSSVSSPLMVLGCGFVLVALGFKLSWVPFHTWTSDVYQGAPVPAAAFLATVSKTAVVVVLIKLLIGFPVWQNEKIILLFSLMAGGSILLGNLLAISQTSLKRLLAYSSIAHFGYLLIAILAGNLLAIWFYIVTYVLASLGIFSVLASLTHIGSDEKGDYFSELRGLGHRHPFLGIALTLSLLSLAGIPLTAGFIGKFFVLAAGVNAAQWILLMIAVLGSAIGIYYYLRVISLLFKTNTEQQSDALNVSLLNRFIVAGLAALTLIIGVWPSVLV